MKYRITAYGPGKECLTWADNTNLELTKEYLKRKGYVVIKVTKDVVE